MFMTRFLINMGNGDILVQKIKLDSNLNVVRILKKSKHLPAQPGLNMLSDDSLGAKTPQPG